VIGREEIDGDIRPQPLDDVAGKKVRAEKGSTPPCILPVAEVWGLNIRGGDEENLN